MWHAALSDDDFDGTSSVRRFATEPALGDAILLRSGQSTVHAVGLIASDYLYLPQFDDVNGWDLQHARRVRWYRLPVPYVFQTSVFGANPRRFARVNASDAVNYARSFVRSSPTEWQTAALPTLPDIEPEMSPVPQTVAAFVTQAVDLFGVYWDSDGFGERPSEDEMIVHYVAPLLRALGWPAENIAVKWRSIDICVFRRLPRVPENLALLIEAKRVGQGVEAALQQAKGYAAVQRASCDLVVTDGFRYRLYRYSEAEKDFLPVAYANLARLKQSSAKFFAIIKRQGNSE